MPDLRLKAFVQMESGGSACYAKDCPLPKSPKTMPCSFIQMSKHGGRTLNCCYLKGIERGENDTRYVICREV